MSEISFSKEEKTQLVSALRNYIQDELKLEIGQFDTEFLLDFISREFGNVYYNRGLHDAQVLMQAHVDGIVEAIYELEK
jgi:uncharacterized protein (DUF2164 family)